MKSEISQLIYSIVHDYHDKWRERHGFAYNNAIIDFLRNRLSDDSQKYVEIHITKRMLEIPNEYRCPVDPLSDLSFRRFKEGFTSKPCEICGFDRAPNIAHIIPKGIVGSDDDWNLIHLCANHHYLFDRGLLTAEEWQSIHWDEKGAEAKYFAEHVRLRQHQEYWNKINTI